MSMLSVLIKDLVEKTTPEDGTYLVAGNTDANKITFLNFVNAIKKKLGAAAQKSVANNLTTAESGTSVLDAYQGKLMNDKIDSLKSTCICSLADNVTRTVSLPSGVTYMTDLHTYTCKKTGLHIITGNINFSYAYGGIRAYEISFGGSVKNITAQIGYSPDYATYIPVSCAVFLKAGDSISFYAQQNSGNTISTKLEVQIMY